MTDPVCSRERSMEWEESMSSSLYDGFGGDLEILSRAVYLEPSCSVSVDKIRQTST